MSDQKSGRVLDVIQTVAIVLSLLLSAGTAWYSAGVYNSAIDKENEAQARAAWLQYLEMAYEEPEMAAWFSTDELRNSENADKYSWYLDRMFQYLDIVLASSDDPKWRSEVVGAISPHAPMLCADPDLVLQHKIAGSSSELTQLFAEAMRTCDLAESTR